jgi:hypothetical protein
MTAQPIHEEDPRDPAIILRILPEREHARFLAEYEAVAVAAAHEVWRYKDLQEFLSRWALLAAAYSKPDFYDRMADVEAGVGEYVSMDEVVARRAGR